MRDVKTAVCGRADGGAPELAASWPAVRPLRHEGPGLGILVHALMAPLRGPDVVVAVLDPRHKGDSSHGDVLRPGGDV
eukprot:CAMPEP_0115732344 /NCGR_PEP_ID=MMETSP0272-20121206/85069_1 /TAXON_ID=71861 /ORGANISM="Scrippsiella trochoidea, Strain CCMP3099" /LENGTH=77 /DNA_ID=CAMNT_0003176243 /DNA_START=187 /DNA_END=417 /DNA_ORIENTATION=-